MDEPMAGQGCELQANSHAQQPQFNHSLEVVSDINTAMGKGYVGIESTIPFM
jgi:hypothetical protein